MLRQILIRGALMALPFVLWYLWAAWARRTGRPMTSTPWPWLIVSGALLVALSLIATVVFHRDNRGERYIPGEVMPDGSVSKGRFEPFTEEP